MPQYTAHESGVLALKNISIARHRLLPLTQWGIVDELTMEELQTVEIDMFALQATIHTIWRQLLQAQRKRSAQSAGGELRHQIANLKKDLADCQDAKRSLR